MSFSTPTLWVSGSTIMRGWDWTAPLFGKIRDPSGLRVVLVVRKTDWQCSDAWLRRSIFSTGRQQHANDVTMAVSRGYSHWCAPTTVSCVAAGTSGTQRLDDATVAVARGCPNRGAAGASSDVDGRTGCDECLDAGAVAVVRGCPDRSVPVNVQQINGSTGGTEHLDDTEVAMIPVFESISGCMLRNYILVRGWVRG